MDTQARQKQIRKVMIDHLKAKGYPNMTSNEILAELKPMWNKLGNLGLLHANWRFDEFVQIHHAEEHLANLKAALHEELRDFVGKQKKP
jgi:hypothetical protein